jgi:hypothetical protein
LLFNKIFNLWHIGFQTRIAEAKFIIFEQLIKELFPNIKGHSSLKDKTTNMLIFLMIIKN